MTDQNIFENRFLAHYNNYKKVCKIMENIKEIKMKRDKKKC